MSQPKAIPLPGLALPHHPGNPTSLQPAAMPRERPPQPPAAPRRISRLLDEDQLSDADTSTLHAAAAERRGKREMSALFRSGLNKRSTLGLAPDVPTRFASMSHAHLQPPPPIPVPGLSMVAAPRFRMTRFGASTQSADGMTMSDPSVHGAHQAKEEILNGNPNVSSAGLSSTASVPGKLRVRIDAGSLLRDRSTIVREDEKIVKNYTTGLDDPHGSWVLNPMDRLRRYWDFYVLVLLLYVATVSVFVFSFLGVLEISSPWFWIERFIDVSFVVDITLSFCTAYETSAGLLERRPRKIAYHYLSTWFAPDALSTFPWDVISLVAGKHTGEPTLLQLPRYIRLLRVLKIVRLMRVLRLKQSFTRLEVYLRLKYGHVRMFILAVSVLLIAHWYGCLFYFFGAISPEGGRSWITESDDPTDLYTLYITALYFSVYTITTIGYVRTKKNLTFSVSGNVALLYLAERTPVSTL
jgi:Ion transport protein